MTSTKATTATPIVDHGTGLDVPRAEVVVRAFSTLSEAHPVLTAAAGLASQQRLRAQAHQVACDRAANDHVVAAAARAVIAADTACTVLVDQIDDWATAALTAPRAAATHTETLGQLVNRLAAGWVRWHLLTEGEDQSGARRLAQAAFQQLGELSVAYNDLVADVHAGRRRLPRCYVPTVPVAA